MLPLCCDVHAIGAQILKKMSKTWHPDAVLHLLRHFCVGWSGLIGGRANLAAIESVEAANSAFMPGIDFEKVKTKKIMRPKHPLI
jgi:hypothetical protein